MLRLQILIPVGTRVVVVCSVLRAVVVTLKYANTHTQMQQQEQVRVARSSHIEH